MKQINVKNNRVRSTLVPAFAFIVLLGSCQKEAASPSDIEHASANSNTVNKYSGLAPQTMWELQQARAATAKYKHIDKALADGYVDISVDVEQMGHHYMKMSLVDAVFDIRQPEILVYNKDHDGVQQLVAVEYAVPLGNPRPEGYTGSQDEWDENRGFGLWLLHAWVWSYNPQGVFNPTNPDVHLH